MRRYETRDGSSGRFWEIALEGTTFTVRFGRVGTQGQVRTKELESTDEAKAETERLVASKLADGYRLVHSDEPLPSQPPPPPVVEVTNPDLEAAIARAPDDPAPYLAYAEWLREQKAPRGDLIVAQHGLHGETDPGRFLTFRRREQALLEQHHALFYGEQIERHAEFVKLEWRWGYWYSATITVEDEAKIGGLSVEDLLTMLLDLSSARFLQQLVLALRPPAAQRYPALVELLAARQLPALRHLVLGDPSPKTGAPPRLGPLGPLLASLPHLHSLRLYGRAELPAKIRLPDLRRLELAAAEAESCGRIGRAEWKALERLQLTFRDEAGLADLKAILDGKRLPALRHLALRRTRATDEIVTCLAASKLLPRLTTLDLSAGSLSEQGAKALLEQGDRFRHLELLVMTGVRLPEELLATIEGLGQKTLSRSARRAAKREGFGEPEPGADADAPTGPGEEPEIPPLEAADADGADEGSIEGDPAELDPAAMSFGDEDQPDSSPA